MMVNHSSWISLVAATAGAIAAPAVQDFPWPINLFAQFGLGGLVLFALCFFAYREQQNNKDREIRHRETMERFATVYEKTAESQNRIADAVDKLTDRISTLERTQADQERLWTRIEKLSKP